MSSSGQNQSQGGAGVQAEEAEDEESSSSSSISSRSTVVEDELEVFRQKWKRDLANSASASGSIADNSNQEEGLSSTEEKARMLFQQGVELEKDGDLFEAIQKYRKAVALVPDIEFRSYTHNLPRSYDQIKNQAEESDEEVADIPLDPEIDLHNEDDSEVDLLVRFSKMKLKSQEHVICEANFPTNSPHISCLPMEILIHILKWVVSSDLDLGSLESFSEVCRGFFVAARASDIWRRVCVLTWGVSGLPIEEPGFGGWRTLFITRPRVNFNGCYISRISYLREGERGFQDNAFYKSWQVVQYHRIVRFFPGGILAMATTAEKNLEVAVKLMHSRDSSGIPGCMFGHYRTVNNRVICVVQKAKTPAPTSRRLSSARPRKGKNNNQLPYVFEVPEQDFHFELEIKGRKNQQLLWLCYTVINKYKNGRELTSEFDVSNPNNYPPMRFSRVKSYTSETVQPLK